MAELTLYRLQSGFYSSRGDYLIKTPKVENTFIDALAGSLVGAEDTVNYYDHVVQDFFTHLTSHQEVLQSPAWRERVLNHALYLLGGDPREALNGFIREQIQAADTGPLHVKFLDETLDYLGSSTERRLTNTQTYYMLLTAIGREARNYNSDSEYFPLLKKWIGKLNLTELLQYWTSDYSRFSDLVTFLHIVFGQRRGSQAHMRLR